MSAGPIQGLRVASLDDMQSMGELASATQVDVGGFTVWKFVFEPGWRFTEHVAPEPCPAPHMGYIERGTLHVVMDDGTEADAGPGTAVVIEPGHDAWTVGDEPCILIDFAGNFA